jgi:hypothetical protein
MRPTVALIVTLTVSLAACVSEPTLATEAPSGLPPMGGALASKQQVATLPLTGTCISQDAQLPVLTFPFLNQVITGTCQFSHLGRADMHLVQRVNVTNGAQTGQVMFTAADGDTLRATASGGSTRIGPNTLTFFGVTIITGGTGRFATATGELQLTGTLSFEQTVGVGIGTASSKYVGWIAYDASDRSLP